MEHRPKPCQAFPLARTDHAANAPRRPHSPPDENGTLRSRECPYLRRDPSPHLMPPALFALTLQVAISITPQSAPCQAITLPALAFARPSPARRSGVITRTSLWSAAVTERFGTYRRGSSTEGGHILHSSSAFRTERRRGRTDLHQVELPVRAVPEDLPAARSRGMSRYTPRQDNRSATAQPFHIFSVLAPLKALSSDLLLCKM